MKKLSSIFALAAGLLPLAAAAQSYGYNGYGSRWGMMMDLGGFGTAMLGLGLVGWLLMILWWAFWIALIVAFVRWIADYFRGVSRGRGTLSILEERYAKGEIDEKEFLEKKKHLSK